MRRIGRRVSLCFCMAVARLRVGFVFFFAQWRLRLTGLFHQGSTSTHHLVCLISKIAPNRTGTGPRKRSLTHARTPPIKPKLYPVAKSSLRPFPMGLSGRLMDSTRDK